MNTRRRPRHPDVLTPREWEVLALLGEGLSNQEIGDRLGISRDGAKYHVSEILGKLGVTDRDEAARWWRSQRAGRLGALAPLVLLREVVLRPVAYAASAAVIVAAVAGIAVLAWAVYASGEADAPAAAAPTPTPDGRSYLIRLDTRERVYEAFVAGRVPLGIVNTVMIDSAYARGEWSLAGDERTQRLKLHVSIVAAVPRHYFREGGGHSYEWWFTGVTAEAEPPTPAPDAAPTLGVALLHVDGAWGTYVEYGSGWEPVDGEFSFGEREVRANMHVDDVWGINDVVRGSMRAMIRHEQPTPEGFHVGDVYPQDGSWTVVGFRR
jgi:DNA-binding CsgD family transcriptional regulator